jgi:RNA-binding protein
MPLTKSHITHLRSLAHHLDPVIIIGQNGVSESLIKELNKALDFHELVKVKIAAGEREDRAGIIETLCEQTAAEKVQAIGKTVTLFRRNPKKPKIELPKK